MPDKRVSRSVDGIHYRPQAGQRVDVMITGATVSQVGVGLTILTIVGAAGGRWELPNVDSVQYSPSAPALWPPRPGETWMIPDTDEMARCRWFAHWDATGETGDLVMTSPGGLVRRPCELLAAAHLAGVEPELMLGDRVGQALTVTASAPDVGPRPVLSLDEPELPDGGCTGFYPDGVPHPYDSIPLPQGWGACGLPESHPIHTSAIGEQLGGAR